MSFVPEVTINVDLATSPLSFSVPSQTVFTGVALLAVLSKTSFFSGVQTGLDSVVSRDATTGIVTSLAANARNNVDGTLLRTTLATTNSTTWLNSTSNGNVLSIGTTFDNAGTRTLVFDIGNAINLQGSSSASMGTWITHMAWHALQVRRPTNVPQFTNLATIVTDINTKLATAIGTALSASGAQSLLVQKIVEANGPVIPMSGGVFQFSSNWTDLDLDLTLNQLTMNCTYYGTIKKLVLSNIPIKIRLQ